MPGLVEVYLRTRKPRDFFTNLYIYRPLAAPVVWWLGRTPVTPNQVTLGSFITAVVAVVILVVCPGYWGLMAGVGVYCCSYILDCADGMLARYRSVASASGHLFDFLMDEIKSFMMLGAVGVRLYLDARAAGDAAAHQHILAGVGGLVCLATGIAITTFQRRPEISVPALAATAASGGRRPLLKRAIRSAEALARFLIHYPSYIPLAALANRIDLYFYPYIAVNALYAGRMLIWLAWRFGIR